MRIKLRCKMLNNGFVEKTIKECRELFKCKIDKVSCNNCSSLEIKELK